jgi:hypothetical protein
VLSTVTPLSAIWWMYMSITQNFTNVLFYHKAHVNKNCVR